MKQYLHYWSVACLVLAVTACGGRAGGYEQEGKQTVKVDTVRAASPLSVLQFPAKVKAAHDIDIAFRVAGTIEKVLVREGDPVKQGQLLAQLDPTDYEVQLRATEAEYKQIKGEAERVMALYKENGTTPNANDKAVYGLQQIEAKYQNHKDQLAYTRIYAPFTGYVQKRLFDENETVGAGMPVISLISRGLPEVELNLPAAQYVRRDRFENYTCTFDVYPGKTYSLKLIGITEKANANQLYTMRLVMEAGTLPLPSPGMNTTVSIACRPEGQEQWTVPAGGIVDEEGKSFVYLYRDGRVHRTEVRILQLKTDGTAVVDCSTLKPGDCVVAAGAHHVADGQEVDVLPSASETNVGGLL